MLPYGLTSCLFFIVSAIGSVYALLRGVNERKAWLESAIYRGLDKRSYLGVCGDMNNFSFQFDFYDANFPFVNRY